MIWAIIIYFIVTVAMLVEGAGVGAFLWPLAILAIPIVVNLFRF